MANIILYIICGIICLIEVAEYIVLTYLLGKVKKRFYSKAFKGIVVALQVVLGFIYAGFVSLIICLFINVIK